MLIYELANIDSANQINLLYGLAEILKPRAELKDFNVSQILRSMSYCDFLYN